MWVYGERVSRTPAAAMIGDLFALCGQCERLSPTFRRHAAATQLLMAVGELTQGLIDAGFLIRGYDDYTRLEASCARALVACGRIFRLSVEEAPHLHTQELRSVLSLLLADWGARDLIVKTCEGFSFYAVYPESY